MIDRKVVNLLGSSTTAPYSPAVITGNLVFVAGQVGFDPVKREFYGSDIVSQTRGALDNLRIVLEYSGANLNSVVKINIFLTDVTDFEIVNSIYAEYFPVNPPARSCFQVVAIPKGALIEIEAIAVKE